MFLQLYQIKYDTRKKNPKQLDILSNSIRYDMT